MKTKLEDNKRRLSETENIITVVKTEKTDLQGKLSKLQALEAENEKLKNEILDLEPESFNENHKGVEDATEKLTNILQKI